MTGKIFLSGGGDENATKMLDEMFFAELPQNSNILYIATGFRESEKIASASEWMQDMINMHGRTDIHYLFADDLTPSNILMTIMPSISAAETPIF